MEQLHSPLLSSIKSYFTCRIDRVGVFVIFAAFWLGACTSKQNTRNLDQPEVNEYPPISLRLLGGETISARDLEGNNVFVFFNPECETCHEEAHSIKQSLGDFKGYTLFFISSAAEQDISAFAEMHGMDSDENVMFAWSPSDGVLDHYGPITTPAIYVYSGSRLKASFNGKTDVAEIIEML